MELTALADAGLDIAHAFPLARFPAVARLLPARPVGVLVGNTRALWPRFVAARRAEPDPLDRYVERALAGVDAVFSHRRYDGAFLPFQRVAIDTGLAAASPSGLLVHPVYGPWFALRAIVAIDGQPPACAPIARACTCTAACEPPRDGDIDAWIETRAACSTGRAQRYSDEQIAHHYAALRAGRNP